MSKPLTVLLPTDFAESTRRAEAMALMLARTHGARVRLLHVVEPISSDAEDGDFHRELADRADQKLRELAAQRMYGLEVEHTVVLGHRAEAIAEEANRCEAWMVVMGTRPWQPGESHLPLISHEVVCRAGRPVLLVP